MLPNAREGRKDCIANVFESIHRDVDKVKLFDASTSCFRGIKNCLQ